MTEIPNKTILQTRRDLMGATLFGAAGGVLSGQLSSASAAESGTSQKANLKALRPAGAPSDDAGYSPAILATGGQMLFISGQGPEDYNYLVEPYPASTAVGTPELAIPGLELEIEAVAVL